MVVGRFLRNRFFFIRIREKLEELKYKIIISIYFGWFLRLMI